MADVPARPRTVIEDAHYMDDAIDLHALAQAMDNIVAKPDSFSKEEMVAVISVAARVVSRYIMVRGALIDEALKVKPDEAKPEGTA